MNKLQARLLGRWGLAALLMSATLQRGLPQEPDKATSRAEAAEATAQNAIPERYNVKFGNGGVYLSLGVKGIYLDNIYLVHDGKKDDFILSPQLNVGAFFPIGQLNTLVANVGVSYYHYLRNHNLNTGTPTVNPNSDLRFNIYSGDFKISLTESFSYEELPFYESGAQFFNIRGTGRFARYFNRAGGTVQWDLHHLVLEAGYHHEDLLSNGSLFDYIDRHSEIVNLGADLSVTPYLTVGLEAAGSWNRFEHKGESDHWRGGGGPALKAKLTDYLRAKLGAGYQRIEYHSDEADALGLKGFNAFYAYAELDHDLNEYFNHSLRVSHDNEVGINAANMEGTHAVYTLNWRATENFTLSPYAGVHHYKESYGPGVDFLYHESFDYVGAGIGLNYALGQHWQLGLKYDYRLKESGDESLGYSQNRVTILVTYLF